MLKHWGKNIRELWYSAAGVVAALLTSSALWAAGDLASVVRAYRQSPTPAHKAAVQAYAVTHPKEAALANLALGVAAFEQKDYPSAIANLKRATVPQVADYAAYYLAAAHVEANELEGVAGEFAPTHNL